jgi:hypothetical protein
MRCPSFEDQMLKPPCVLVKPAKIENGTQMTQIKQIYADFSLVNTTQLLCSFQLFSYSVIRSFEKICANLLNLRHLRAHSNSLEMSNRKFKEIIK